MNRFEATSKLTIIILILLLAITLHCLALAENLDPIQIVKDYRLHMTPIGKYEQAAKWIGTKVVMKVGTLVPLIADPGIYNHDYIVVFPDYQKDDITLSHNVLPEEISRIQAAGKSVVEVIGTPFLREEYHLPTAFFPEGTRFLVHRIENITSNTGKIEFPHIQTISYKIMGKCSQKDHYCLDNKIS